MKTLATKEIADRVTNETKEKLLEIQKYHDFMMDKLQLLELLLPQVKDLFKKHQLTVHGIEYAHAGGMDGKITEGSRLKVGLMVTSKRTYKVGREKFCEALEEKVLSSFGISCGVNQFSFVRDEKDTSTEPKKILTELWV